MTVFKANLTIQTHNFCNVCLCTVQENVMWKKMFENHFKFSFESHLECFKMSLYKNTII